jgi:O-antigen ligase
MRFDDNPFTLSPGRVGALPAVRRPGWNAQRAVFAPVLLASACVQVLCHPFVRRWLLALMILDIPLQCGTHLGFRPDAALRGAIEGFDLSITSLALCGLYVGWIFTARTRNEKLQFSVHWPIAAYTVIVAASWWVATDGTLSLFQVFLLAQMLLFYIYVSGNVHSRQEIAWIVWFLLAGAAVESLLVLALAMTGHELAFLRIVGIKTSVYLPGPAGGFTRPGGTVGSPNYTSAYLGMLMTLAVCVWQTQALRRYRRLAILVVFLAAIALACTFSRGGWIGVALSLTILGVARWHRGGFSRKAAAASMAALVLAAAFLFVPNPISTRVMGDDEGSAHSRIPLMHLALRVIEANPLLGVGANNFGTVMNDYAGSEFRREWIYTVHNQFLLVCAETGIIGLMAYLWILLSVIRNGWRLWKIGDEVLSPLALGLTAAVIGLISHMLVDIFSARPITELVWLFAALLAVMEAIVQRERPDALGRSQTMTSRTDKRLTRTH